jgi:hypothetical protein
MSLFAKGFTGALTTYIACDTWIVHEMQPNRSKILFKETAFKLAAPLTIPWDYFMNNQKLRQENKIWLKKLNDVYQEHATNE